MIYNNLCFDHAFQSLIQFHDCFVSYWKSRLTCEKKLQKEIGSDFFLANLNPALINGSQCLANLYHAVLKAKQRRGFLVFH